MRVFLPLHFAELRRVVDDRRLTGPRTGYAVTPELREWYASGDQDELEYAALTLAARGSLRLIHASGDLPLRVVLAADVDDQHVRLRDADDRGAVSISADVPISDISAVFVDERAARPVVAAAAGAIMAADLDDDDAEFVVSEADALELAWYATQEIDHLMAAPSTQAPWDDGPS